MILDAIFHGDLSVDNFPYPNAPEYKQAAAKVNTKSMEVKEKLSPEQYALVEQLLSEVYAAQYLEATACFRTGVAVGVELQSEIEQELQFLDEK